MVIVHFENDTHLSLTAKVHQSSHLLNVVEFDKPKHATPITFDWTKIIYPKKCEVKYKDLCMKEKLLSTLSLVNTLVMFDRSSNSLRLLESYLTPHFQPPLFRSSSINPSSSSKVYTPILTKPFSGNFAQSSFT